MSKHYEEALIWIRQNRFTESAESLAKMVLSLYSRDCGFAFSECMSNLDAYPRALCMRMCEEYSRVGETDELRLVGKQLADQLYPRLWIQCEAMSEARREWQRMRDAKWKEEQEENREEAKVLEENDHLRGTYR